MNIQDMLEQEKRKAQQAAEAKIQAKLHRKLRILKKEKMAFTQATNFDRSKQARSLRLLEMEKEVEIENYLATKSPAIEAKYHYDAGVVRNLVKTRGIVEDLLTSEKTSDKRLLDQIHHMEDAILQEKRAVTLQDIENSKFRIPEQDKMDKRVQIANSKYHTQRHKNIELQKEIDSAIFTRHFFQHEEAKLNKELHDLDLKVKGVMSDVSYIFEEREHVEGTRLKVREHLARVKEECERELLGITLALSEDKKSEEFMRTKLKDNAQTLREIKAKEHDQVEGMILQKDEFGLAFDKIKEAMGNSDINDIVHDFLEQEENNFATFLNIGLLMDHSKKLRSEIDDLAQNNVKMENSALEATQSQRQEIKTIEKHTAALVKKIQDCNARKEEINQDLQEFLQHLEKTVKLMKIDEGILVNVVGRDAVMSEKNALKYLEVVMHEIGSYINDLTMVELTARGTKLTGDRSADENMLVRKPSIKIPPIVQPRTSLVPLRTEGLQELRRVDLMVPSAIRDVVLKDMAKPPEPEKRRSSVVRRKSSSKKP